MVKLLHTGDWHVGKVLRGMTRLDEHRGVLSDLVRTVEGESVDVVVVAGDVFESAVPPPEATALAWRGLLDLRDTGAEVVVIAGNHDSADAFDAIAPLFAAAGVHMLGRPRRPHDGGIVELAARASGEPIQLALLPFVSQRSVVRAAQLLRADAAEAFATYAERTAALVDALVEPLRDDAVRVLVAHATMAGGLLGGGERDAQSVFDYALASLVFPASLHYVALGHLHRQQLVPGRCPIAYSGAPLAVDFGERDDTKGALIVEATASSPAVVRSVPVAGGRRLRAVRLTYAELEAQAAAIAETADAFKVTIVGATHAGLVEDVRSKLPNVLEVRVDKEVPSSAERHVSLGGAEQRSDHQLFAAFLADQGHADPRLERLFAELADGLGEH